MRYILMMTVAMMACATPVLAQPAGNTDAPQEPGKTYIHPSFMLMPTGDRMAQYYPPLALKEHRKGMSVIDCGWDLNGDAQDCHIASETPADYGFGQAMLDAMQGHLRINLAKLSEAPENGRFRLAYKWTPG